MRSEKGKILRKLPPLIILIVTAAVLFFAGRLFAAHIPWVTITSPDGGDVVSGTIQVSCDYGISNGNVHTLILYAAGAEVERVAVLQQEGSYIFSIDTTAYPDGALEIVVEANSAAPPAGHSSDDSVTVTVNHVQEDNEPPEVSLSSHTDGQTVVTQTIDLAGTATDATSGVVSVEVNGDAASLNGNSWTMSGFALDEGPNPITVEAEDAAGHTALVTITINYVVPECFDDAGCDDGVALTIDSCVGPGTAQAVCEHTAVACMTDADCDDGNTRTADTCSNGGTISASCSHAAIACLANDDCDDGSPLTTDICINPGAADASCSHTTCPVACSSDAGCNDENPITTDTCGNPGTCSAACIHTPCAVACTADAGCDDGNALTIDSCVSPGACAAACTHTPCAIACSADSECDDSNTETADTCSAPGTCEAVCQHTPVEPEPVPLTLTVTAPTDGTITNNPSVTVAGTTAPDATLTINGQTAAVGVEGAYSVTIRLNEGSNSINIIAVQGEERLEETVTVILDTKAPSIMSSEPADGAEIEIAPTRIAIHIEDNPGGVGLDESEIIVSLDGEELAGNYNTTTKSYEAAIERPANGRHIILISASDLAGNTLDAALAFVLAGKGPKIKILKVPGKVIEGKSSQSSVPESGETTQFTGASGFESAPPTEQMVLSGSASPLMTLGADTSTDFETCLDKSDWGCLLRERYENLRQWISSIVDAPSAPEFPLWMFISGPDDETEDTSDATPAFDLTEAMPPAGEPTADDLSLSGDVEAEIEVVDAPVDGETVEVTIDGERAKHEYDPATKKIKCRANGLKRGAHVVTVAAADTDGNVGVATTAFDIDPVIYSVHIETPNRSDGHIGAGDLFRITVVMDEPNVTGAWAVLFSNIDNEPVAGGTGPGNTVNWVGNVYPLQEQPGGGPSQYTYTTEGWLYTSAGHDGRDAPAVFAAVPLDNPPANYDYSSESLAVDGPVAPSINSATLKNSADPNSRTINLNDYYEIEANGSIGVQSAQWWLIDPEYFAGTGDLVGSNLKIGTMSENPGGGGSYSLETPVQLDNLFLPSQKEARVVMAVVRPQAWNASGIGAAGSNVLYIGPTPAPQFTNVTLENADHPGEPLRVLQHFRVRIEGNIDPAHEPYLKLQLVDADRFPQGWRPWNGNGAFINMAYLEGGIRRISDGVYEGTGILVDLHNSGGQSVTNAAAIVTAASFYDYALSNTVAAEPPAEPDIDRVTIRNADFPDRMTVAPGENVVVTAYGDPGQNLVCKIAGISMEEHTPDAIFFDVLIMTDHGDGTYTCGGAVPDPLPECAPGIPVRAVRANVKTASGQGETVPPEWLTIRQDIVAVHIRNSERPSNPDIHDGEHVEITVLATSQLQSPLAGYLIDTAMTGPESVLLQMPEGTIAYQGTEGGLQVYTGLVELTPGLVPQQVKNLRVIMYVPNEPGAQNWVFSTEILDYEYTPPTPTTPTVITAVDGAPVVNGEVTGADTTPSIEGTAPAGATVRVYEFIEGAGVELQPVTGGPPLSAIYDSQQNSYIVSGPALSMNGVAYDGLGTSGFIVDPCMVDGPATMPALDVCITGEKDVHAFLITATDLMMEGGTILPELKVTFYSAGDPSVQGDDQYALIKQLFDTLVSGHTISRYSIDAHGVALRAPAAGAPDPYELVSPLIAQEQLCRDVPGAPGSLNYDPSSGKYVASRTPLAYNGTVYDNYVIFGPAEGGDGPLILVDQLTPIWWAPGASNISAAVFAQPSGGGNMTIYGEPQLLNIISQDIQIIARADNVLIAPADPQHATPDPSDDNYTWNAAALDAQNITIAPVESCSSGKYELIAQTTTGDTGAFTAPETIVTLAPGDHILAANSEKNGVTSPWSDPVTYHLTGGGGDTTAPEINVVSGGPDVISPGNPTSQEVNDEFRIIADITDESPVDWWLSIYTDANAVRVISGSGYHVDVAWDGRDDQGNVVEDGLHNSKLTVIDEADNDAELSGEVCVDNTSPTMQILAPLNTTTVSGNMTIRASAEDTPDCSAITSVEAVILGTSVHLNLMPANEAYETIWNTTAVPNRPHTVEVRATDAGGNWAKTTVDVEVQNEETPPTIELISPAEGSYTNNSNPIVEVHVNDELGGSGVDPGSVKWVCQGKPYDYSACGYPFSVSPDPNDETVFYLNFYTPFTESTAVGIILEATDKAGNKTVEELHWIVDLDIPVIEPGYPLPDGTVNSANPVIWMILKDDTSDISTNTIYLSLDGVKIDAYQYDSNTDRLEFQASIDDHPGNHVISVSVSDKAGNYASKQWQFTFDDIAPTIVFIYPSEFACSNNPRPTVLARVYDNPSGSGVDIESLRWSSPGYPFEVAPQSGDVYEITFDGTFPDGLPQGVATITLAASDKAGNKAEKTLQWLVDTKAPTISDAEVSTDPFSPNGDGEKEDTTITAKVNDISLESWTLKIKETNTLLAEGTEKNLSVTWNGDGFEDGTYTYIISAVDCAGNKTEYQGGVSIDKTPPVISDVSVFPSPFSPTNITSKEVKDFSRITATVNDPFLDYWQVEIKVQQSEALSVKGSGGKLDVTWLGKNIVIGTSYPDGNYDCIIAAIDKAGNRSETLTTVTIDDTSPILNIVSPAQGSLLKGAYHEFRVVIFDESAIENIELWENNSKLNAVCLPDGVASLMYTCTLNASSMAPMKHFIKARAVDAAGNVGFSSEVEVILIKNEAPEVWIKEISPLFEKYIVPVSIRSVSVKVGFKAPAFAKVGYLELYIDDDPTPVSHYVKPPKEEGTYTFALDLSEQSQGSHVILAKAYLQPPVFDQIGISDPVTINIDNTGPTITAVEPTPDAELPAGTVSIRVKIEDDGIGIDTTSINLTLLSPSGEQMQLDIYNNGAYYVDVLLVENGEYTATVSGADLLGNQGQPTIWSFRIKAPDNGIAIIYPTSDTYIGGVVLVRVIFTNDQLNPVTEVGLTINGNTFNWAPNPAQKDHIFEIDTSEYKLDGKYILQASAKTETATSQSEPVEVNIDNTPPEVTAVQPEQGAVVEENVVQIKINVTDFENGSGIDPATGTIIVDDYPPAKPDYTPISAAEGTFKYTIKLPPGPHTAVIAFSDLVGNMSLLYQWEFEVSDSGAPLAYVPVFLDNKLLRIENASGVQRIPVEGMPANPISVDMKTDNGRTAYAISMGEDKITAIEERVGPNGELLELIVRYPLSIGNMPWDIELSFLDRVYISGKLSGLAAGANLPPYSFEDVGLSPAKVVSSADGRRIYTAIQGEDRVSVIEDGHVVMEIPSLSGSRPQALALDPTGGNKLYIANTDLNSVSVVSLSEPLALLNLIETGARPVDVGIDPKGRHLWVACQASNLLEIYSLTTFEREKAVFFPGPTRIDFSEDGSAAHISSVSFNQVLSINTLTLDAIQ